MSQDDNSDGPKRAASPPQRPTPPTPPPLPGQGAKTAAATPRRPATSYGLDPPQKAPDWGSYPPAQRPPAAPGAASPPGYGAPSGGGWSHGYDAAEPAYGSHGYGYPQTPDSEGTDWSGYSADYDDDDAESPSRPELPPDLRRQRATRVMGRLDEKSVHKLIDIKGSLSTIELTLTAITIAVIVLKVAFGELSAQINSLVAGGTARQVLDVSVSVGFLAIVVATLQIPRHFTDALIFANQSTLRILFQVGATPAFVARCFGQVILAAMVRAVGYGLVASAILYLAISEVAQLWVPVTRTFFLLDVAEVVAAIGVFILVVHLLVRWKVEAFYRGMQQW
ncbi:MAG: hypothetical protein NW205_11770 [Hyphomicrobiaceae bacterium]|nr:hypothetical protein [Hyphomicrobiaceae bacterium]